VKLFVKQYGYAEYLKELVYHKQKSTPVYVDNEEVLKLVRNPVFHERTKHIEVQ
ncbi:hypothetical protein KI387_040225, partial [Taxus chinensis]